MAESEQTNIPLQLHIPPTAEQQEMPLLRFELTYNSCLSGLHSTDGVVVGVQVQPLAFVRLFVDEVCRYAPAKAVWKVANMSHSI